MKLIRLVLVLVIAAVSLNAFAQQNKKYVKATEMYLYGMGYSLSDSVAYFTEVLAVDGSWYEKKTGFLYARNEYSAQLRTCLEGRDVKLPFTVISFNKKRPKLEKDYLKMAEKLLKEGYVIKHIPGSEFRFDGVEYVAPEEEQVEQKPVKQKKAKKK